MRHCFRILALLLLSSNVLIANPRLSPEEVTEFLTEAGYPSVKLARIEGMSGSGYNTASVRRIPVSEGSDQRHLVCKELKGMKDERRNLQRLQPLVDEHEVSRKSQPRTFPPRDLSIARFVGALRKSGTDFVFFEEASGESVNNLIMTWGSRGYNWAGLAPEDTIGKLVYAFSNIGRAIATFHLKHGEFDEGKNTFNSIIHGDLHASNVFYNLISNQVTLIDYETMRKGDIFYDIERLFQFSRNQKRPLFEAEAGRAFIETWGPHFVDAEGEKQRDIFIRNYLSRLDMFFTYLKEGYIRAFGDAGYNINIETGRVTLLSS